jgi:hypothetical protein
VSRRRRAQISCDITAALYDERPTATLLRRSLGGWARVRGVASSGQCVLRAAPHTCMTSRTFVIVKGRPSVGEHTHRCRALCHVIGNGIWRVITVSCARTGACGFSFGHTGRRACGSELRYESFSLNVTGCVREGCESLGTRRAHQAMWWPDEQCMGSNVVVIWAVVRVAR